MTTPTIYVCTTEHMPALFSGKSLGPCSERLRGFTLDAGHCSVCLEDLTPIPYGEQTAAPLVTVAQIMPLITAAARLLDTTRALTRDPHERAKDWSDLRDALRPWRVHGTAPRVFTEDEVRPLWDALQAASETECECAGFYRCNGCEKRAPRIAELALDAFPAPEDWTR